MEQINKKLVNTNGLFLAMSYLVFWVLILETKGADILSGKTTDIVWVVALVLLAAGQLWTLPKLIGRQIAIEQPNKEQLHKTTLFFIAIFIVCFGVVFMLGTAGILSDRAANIMGSASLFLLAGIQLWGIFRILKMQK